MVQNDPTVKAWRSLMVILAVAAVLARWQVLRLESAPPSQAGPSADVPRPSENSYSVDGLRLMDTLEEVRQVHPDLSRLPADAEVVFECNNRETRVTFSAGDQPRVLRVVGVELRLGGSVLGRAGEPYTAVQERFQRAGIRPIPGNPTAVGLFYSGVTIPLLNDRVACVTLQETE